MPDDDPPESNKQEGFERDEYWKMRDSITTLTSDAGKTFDKGILTLSAGALALSVTLLDKGFPFGERKWLIWSWIFFIAALCFNLISQLVSMASCQRDLDWANRCMTRQMYIDEKNPYMRWIWFLNLVAMMSFVSGISSMASFAATGLKEARMSDKTLNGKDNGEKVEKSSQGWSRPVPKPSPAPPPPAPPPDKKQDKK